MNINKLKHRVTIQQQNGTLNDGGGNIKPNWVDVVTVWASVSPINAQESIIAERRGQQVTHSISVRYRTDISPKMRLLFNGRVLDIQTIVNINEENKELKIQCLEV
jgi:SPP1 family predicted phage head-tail adaptor